MNLCSDHQFHIPVMGIAFTIDTPVKVAHYNISSVISLGDDQLIEKMRAFYSEKFHLPYEHISEKNINHRAERITAYLNLVNDLVGVNFDYLKSLDLDDERLARYFLMLPDNSPLRNIFLNLNQIKNKDFRNKIEIFLRRNMKPGAIDVNIMTKLDKVNYTRDRKELEYIYNDAHAALRGFANSNLTSSVVFSAGMNLSLFNYITVFSDFLPCKNGILKKKIILKVSDYRSAYIQGKILAKKGVWVSEFRIESGLNCGGHAFATEGYLTGPILEEFKLNRENLRAELHDLFISALSAANRSVPPTPLPQKITVQGGIGTHAEHHFLLQHFQVDAIGWGTPFLLVPEAVNVDEETLNMLCAAGEKDLYLSNISPLGIPFHSLKGNTKDVERVSNIEKGRPGSACPKKFLALNKDYKKEGLCSASREFQKIKIEELEKERLDADKFSKEFKKITDKSCICVGLGTSVLLVNKMENRVEGKGVSICPGPNMAYFSQISTLMEMADHIYGRISLLNKTTRPHMFIKELQLYVDYLQKELIENTDFSKKSLSRIEQFRQNLIAGIVYYKELMPLMAEFSAEAKKLFTQSLHSIEHILVQLEITQPENV